MGCGEFRCRLLLLVTLLGVGCLLFGGAIARAAVPRVALVIGNQAYDGDLRLYNPVADAKAVARRLRALGFKVVEGYDLDQEKTDKIINRFIDELNEDAVGLFYYAGHGAQLEGTNYLLPVHTPIPTPSHLKYKALPIELVLDRMAEAGCRLKVAMIDACRNDPFRRFRGAQKGLAEMASPPGSVIIFSTAPGHVARDGLPGTHSPFADAVVSALERPGLDLPDLFNIVGQKVARDTQGKQRPWLTSNFYDDFKFDGRTAVAEAGSPPSELH